VVISNSFVGNHGILFSLCSLPSYSQQMELEGVVCADDKRPEEGTVGREEDEGGN